MSNPTDHTVRPLLFFPMLAILVIVVVVGVIRIVPDRSRPSEGATEQRPPVRPEPPSISADEGQPPANAISPANNEPGDPELPEPDFVSPLGAADEPEDTSADALEEPGVQVAKPDSGSSTVLRGGDESEDPSERAAVSDGGETTEDSCEVEGWRLGPVRIATSLFGFRTVGVVGPRYAVAVPRDQRYLWITANFTRSAETAGSIVIAPHEGVLSTLTLSGEGEDYPPVGIVREDARPWAPFDASAVLVGSGSSAEVTLAYQVPDVLPRVTVAVEGVSCAELELPPAARLAIHELVGHWVKSPELISSLRFEDAIADAIASRERLLLHFEPAGVDTVRATFPGPGIASTPLERSPRAHSGTFRLQWGEHASPAWVRMTKGGRRVLLYIGEASGPALLFEPAE